MMKMLKLKGKLSVLALVMILVLTACSTEPTSGASNNKMDDEMMEEDKMDDEMMEENKMNDEMMDNQETMMNEGDAAPMFALNDLAGNEVKLEDLKGEKVYVKYWASWCSICLSGMEDLNTLAGEDHDFRVISIVTPDYKGEQSAADFTEWFESQPYSNLTVLLDTDGEYAKEFGLRGFPSSYYIGSDGILVKSSPGHVANDAITSAFKEIK